MSALHAANIMTRATIGSTLRTAAQRLRAVAESPQLDAEILLGKVLGLSRAALIARAEQPIALDDERAFDQLIAQRATGTPVAYLTGQKEFWSLTLQVTPAVLVPRPETETLVECALQLKAAGSACSVLDLGTGSGAIALAIAAERPEWQVTGVDICEDALRIARQNSAALGTSARGSTSRGSTSRGSPSRGTSIDWRLGSWFDAVPDQRFDLIISNPPYVASADPALTKLSAEPLLALSPGPSGLEALEAIIGQAPRYLHSGGWLLLEHGHTQADAVTQRLTRSGFTSIRTYPDLSGKSRVTLGTIHS
jgi:release factor glutamine methyltransferase